MHLTDEQWHLLEPLFPPPSAAARGRPPLDKRIIFDAILWKLATNEPWYDMPLEYPPHQTCYRHYHHWDRSGLLKEALAILHKDLQTRGGLDLEQALHDGRITLLVGHRRIAVEYVDSLRDTWQLQTALIFIGLIEKTARSFTATPLRPPCLT
jgi:transposase